MIPKSIFSYTFIIIFLLSLKALNAQVVYEPTYKTVYGYLSRLAQKGVIEMDDIVLPVSRAYISNKLDTLSFHSDKLTPLEKQELVFYKKEYTLERNIEQNVELVSPYKSIFQTQKGDRFRWGAYQDKQFTINAQLIGGYEGELTQNNSINHHTWRGLWLYGYLGKNIGYSFDFRDNTERGENLSIGNPFTPSTGIIGPKYVNNFIEYSEVKGGISTSWKWGSVFIGKEFLNWGYGEGGKIVLSQKAPSFPMIRLDVNPVKWLRFNYQHCWLNSNIIDSTTITKTTTPNIDQYNFRDKLLASHSLTFIPTKGLSITAGESVIYNDGLKIGFLIPVLFFKLVDHYMGGQYTTPNISNSQIFFQFSSRNQIKKTHLYFSYFVDEISLGTLFTEDKIRNQSAYTAGISISDFIIPNLFVNVEYTKIRPFVYINRVKAQSYKSADYYLGHWIGPNADQFYTQFQYRVARGLTFKGIFEYIRKGEQGPDSLQDTDSSTPFLGGVVHNLVNFSFEGKYELIHDLFLKCKYTDRQTFDNIPRLGTNNIRLFNFGFNYGF